MDERSKTSNPYAETVTSMSPLLPKNPYTGQKQKMNPERAKLVADALRSGKYKQGRGALHHNGCHCAAGVMCEVALQNGLELEVNKNWLTTTFDGNISMMPHSVSKWYNEDRFGWLFALNDTYGADFDQIATVFDNLAAE